MANNIYGAGITAIGYFENLGSFFPTLEKLSGKKFTSNDKKMKNRYFEDQWEYDHEKMICLNSRLEEVACDSNEITTICVDTGEYSCTSHDKLYVRFDSEFPGTLKSNSWRGSKIDVLSRLRESEPVTVSAVDSIISKPVIHTQPETKLVSTSKSGVARIGWVDNLDSYMDDIKNCAKLNYIEYSKINTFIEEQWDNKHTYVLCYDSSMERVDHDDPSIKTILINTGITTPDNKEIYVRFDRNEPADLDSGNWRGVKVVTLEDLTAGDSFEEFSFVSDYYMTAYTYNKKTGCNLDQDGMKQLIYKSYETAKANDAIGKVSRFDNAGVQVAFFELLGSMTLTQNRVFIQMTKHNNPDHQKWYGAFIVSENELKEKLLDYYTLHYGPFIFSNTTILNRFYELLAQKAMKENWNYSNDNEKKNYEILRQYVYHTYLRLRDEDNNAADGDKKIRRIDDKVYFNSGLLNKLFKQIIIVGDAYELTEDVKGLGKCTWLLLKNPNAYAENETIIARNIESNNMVRTATYFTDYRQVVFDATLAIHLNDNHVFLDGVARGRIPKYKAEYEKVKNDEYKLDALLRKISDDFTNAIKRAQLMAERNNKLAVPQYWKETGEIQFLLPIYLEDNEESDKPQCALVLSLDTSGRVHYYRGETILDLKMAYNNSRLIAKPEVFWLNDITS